MNNKYKVIALIGKAGAGKDSLLKEIIKTSNFNPIISCTTRPPREGEVGGVDYHFFTRDMFAEYESEGKFLESTFFKGWHYGTPIDSLKKDKVNIGVFNPAGIHSLLKNKDIDLTVYYIEVDDKIRLLRQLNREINPDVKEIVRRFEADEIDFTDINFEYKSIINNSSPDLYSNAKDIVSWHSASNDLGNSIQ